MQAYHSYGKYFHRSRGPAGAGRGDLNTEYDSDGRAQPGDRPGSVRCPIGMAHCHGDGRAGPRVLPDLDSTVPLEIAAAVPAPHRGAKAGPGAPSNRLVTKPGEAPGPDAGTR